MKKTEMVRMAQEKECPECGERYIEKIESVVYECERCIGRHEE
ncbi:protein YhfH [Sporosarcina pasteurii]|uniref:YhfH-like protein n=1 Tax=Sporosarcina pasteurii TaxID=1474 RepID=A0A380BTQ5_SPOPA|nr:YhfH family protein [Sporosarcina pasteurii]MDS9471285.1 YhfH family protein [Sporosarcina pasteurii]QBQ05084.1 YhfH family protein [Sporosarcina pasteurii]SUJ06809.1 Uncharacterised protein [Sporosarcina pasteurii]